MINKLQYLIELCGIILFHKSIKIQYHFTIMKNLQHKLLNGYTFLPI